MDYKDLVTQYDKITLKRNLSGAKALAAVKQDGFALQYVKEQAPELCLAAVNEDGFALQYVNSSIIAQLRGNKVMTFFKNLFKRDK